jgi:hypothetical protein
MAAACSLLLYRNQQCGGSGLYILMPIQFKIRIRILPQVLQVLENPNKNFTFIHSSATLSCFVFLINVIGVIDSNTLDNILKFSGKKYSLALHLVEINTDPDPSKICRSDRIRIHNTGNQHWGNSLQVVVNRLGRMCDPIQFNAIVLYIHLSLYRLKILIWLAAPTNLSSLGTPLLTLLMNFQR